ncbi:MAG: hypothetical protein JSU74_06000 [Candidatus Zixiibacteriota bacterium]|nr:MAG: hypothetical protein JSU74_06000 [candidate division Zixibacteria bacterium]
MLRRTLLLLILSLLFWILGCSDSATDPDQGSGTFNLNDQFGSFTDSDEELAFDDPRLLALASDDETYDDPILSTAGMNSLLADDESGFYHLRIVWGRLYFDTSATKVTDWSGSLAINRGAEIVRRVIRFESNQDYVLPRTDRRLVEWVSKTTVHHDGIAVDIVIPKTRPFMDTTTVIDISSENDTTEIIVIDTAYPMLDPVRVVFETGPYRSTFTLSEISALDTIIYLDDSNSVALHGLKLDSRPCPRGFLSGVWGLDEEGRGVFRGLWISRNGQVTGFLKGRYGVNADGMEVFKGKWITSTGSFGGLLNGTYHHYADQEVNDAESVRPGGSFRGKIYSARRVEVGVLKGRFRASSLVNDGFFQGRWRVICPDLDDQSDNMEENF